MFPEGRPMPEHAPAYARYYFERTNGQNNLLQSLRDDQQATVDFILSIPEDKADFQYADGKWSVKSVIQHIIDTERILLTRALRLARKDATPLPGFDEDRYAEAAPTDSRSLESLAKEFETVRETGIMLYANMNDSMADFVGSANNNPITARNIGWFIIGHNMHHRGIIAERYLVDAEDL